MYDLKGVTKLSGTSHGTDGTVFSGGLQQKFIKRPFCGSKHVTLNGTVEKKRLLPPVCPREMASLKIRAPNVKCKACEKYGQVKVLFADPGRKYTRAFAGEVVRMFLGSTSQIRR
jgi:hypothetical protein